MSNDPIMVEMLQGFVHSHDFVKFERVNPETKNKEIGHELVPRGLEMVASAIYLDPEFLFKILRPTVGTRVYESEEGTQTRDLYFTGVQGGPKPGGGNYRWLKIGKIKSKINYDRVSGDPYVVVWVQIGNRKWQKAGTIPVSAEVLDSKPLDAAEAQDKVNEL